MVLDSALTAQVQAQLEARIPAISERWYQELLTTGFPNQPPVAVRQRITGLARRFIALLFAEVIDRRVAPEIGAALVELGFHEPEAIGLTEQVLGHVLIADLPAELIRALLPHLATLLGAIAAGFVGELETVVRTTQIQACSATEVSLRAAQERLHLVVEHAPIILFAFDRGGVITLAEGRGLKALGHRPDDLIGRSVLEGATIIPDLPNHVRRALSGDSFTITATVRALVFETSYAPVWDEHHTVIGALGMAIDTTARMRAEAVVRCIEAGLSPAEQRVLPLLAREQLNYRQIGALLSISSETVRDHMQRIADKLAVQAHREAVVAVANQRGLLPPAASLATLGERTPGSGEKVPRHLG